MKIASGLTRMQRMITDQIRVNPHNPRHPRAIKM
jgi:hypothetical protein